MGNTIKQLYIKICIHRSTIPFYDTLHLCLLDCVNITSLTFTSRRCSNRVLLRFELTFERLGQVFHFQPISPCPLKPLSCSLWPLLPRRLRKPSLLTQKTFVTLNQMWSSKKSWSRTLGEAESLAGLSRPLRVLSRRVALGSAYGRSSYCRPDLVRRWLELSEKRLILRW